MSYNGSGTFQINTSGQPVVAGTVISSTAFNALTADLATGLSTAITKDGQTTTTARIPFAAGISSTLTTDSSSVSTGSIITAGGIGAAKAAYIGTTLNVGGASTFTGAIAVDSVTDSTSTTTGSIQTDGGLGVAKAVYVGTTANVAGAVTLQSTLGVTGVATLTAQPILSSLTASSAVATDASKGLVSVTNTGTGNNVLATSPTLTTPALGTPSALVLTNATGLPAAQLTGTQTLPRGTLPTGTVLQVVQATTTAQSSTTSSSFVTTSFSASITPSSSTSKILAMVTAVAFTGTTNQQSYFTLYRDATNLNSTGFVDMLSSAGQLLSNQAFQYLDSPATTSATTYTLYFKTDGPGIFYLNVNPQISSITLMEIAA